MALFAIFGVNSLIFSATLLIGLYFYLVRNYNYWTKLGIPGPKPVVFFGTMWQLFFKSQHDYVLDNTKKYGKWGQFFGNYPMLMIADREIIKDINIKDFHLFSDRNHIITLNDRSLLNLFGNDWKNMRSIISPTFSSGKMKRMHPIIVDCVQILVEELDKKCSERGVTEIQLKQMMSNLTMDVIASCAFGTKIDTYGKEQSEFQINAKRVFQGGFRMWTFSFVLTTMPKLIEWTGFKMQDPKISGFFKNTIRSMIARRKAEKREYNDYLQIMIEAMDKTSEAEEKDLIEDRSEEILGKPDSSTNAKSNKTKINVQEIDILANSLLFLVAGFETTGTLLTFPFYSLSLDEKRQQKLYKEVMQFKGDFSYENISRMPYIEACVAETLRLYNPLSNTERIAAEDYTLGKSGITIPKGTIVQLDIQTLHHSPEYYPDPYRWEPERFMPENRDKLVPYTYMPFGMGPRNCVGMRFALMATKTAIAHLITRFRFSPIARTQVPLKPLKFEELFNCGEVYVGIEKR